MRPYRPTLLLVLWVAAALPALAGAGHYAITQEQIAAAITNGGMQVSPDQVSFLSQVFARVALPALQLKSVSPDGSRGMIARLECVNSMQCLPFMVALHGNSVALSPAVQEPNPVPSNPGAPLAHVGARAVLLLEGAHVHISIPVICLENGGMGQTIRVTSPDRRQSYTAQVVGERILRGSL